MRSTRGRPTTIDHDRVQSIILQYENDIFSKDGKIVGKTGEGWEKIAAETNLTPLTLYTYVTCNRMNIRDKLLSGRCQSESFSQRENTSKKRNRQANESLDSSQNCSLAETEATLEISFSKAEFDNLVEYKLYKRTEKKRRYITHRRYAVLKPGEWQLLVTKKLWEKYEHPCGYHFKTHKIHMASSTGTFSGQCKCGSTLTGFIKNLTEQVIPVTCVVTPGDERCGKRYLRQPERYEIAKELREKNKSAAVYRCQKASTMMREGGTEPAHLYKADVLKQAKKEYIAEQHKDSDPLRSLELLQASTYKEIIHGIGLNPFYVHYWTNNQVHVYRESVKKEHICVPLDATGSIIRKLDRAGGTKSRHIFLYECVIRTEEGQFPVAQMLSESHNTVCIQYWLMVWTRTGAPPPKEVVCDGAKALLSAAIRAFTHHTTLHEYSNACMHAIPDCYVRIDVAHFIKTYVDFFKSVTPRIKKFWLASIGQLVLTRDIHEAEALLEAILIVARSETEGVMSNGQLTQCEIFKTKLKIFLTDMTVLSLIPNETTTTGHSTEQGESARTPDSCEDGRDEIEDDPTGNHSGSSWYEWAARIDRKVCGIIKVEEGDHDNAHHSPKLAGRLLKDIKLFPLWSCVVRDQFGYGRVPASSTSVESDFNNIKTRLLNIQPLPIRVDDFIEAHIELLTGKMMIVDAQLNDNKNQFSSPSESYEEKIDDLATSRSPLAVPVERFITKDSEVTSKSDVTHAPIRCQVCADGNEPTGAHRCVMCNKAVHIIAGCSAPIDGEDEGYGSKRVCRSCEKIESYQTYENWKNLANKPVQKKKKKVNEPIVSKESKSAIGVPLASLIDSMEADIETSSNYENEKKKVPESNNTEEVDVTIKENENIDHNQTRNLNKSSRKTEALALHDVNRDNLVVRSNSETKERTIEVNDENTENQSPISKSTTKKSTKVSRYLTKNTVENICNLNQKVSTMPILKNGSSFALTSIAMNGKKITLQLTCPHDSCFQLFLCAAVDYESVGAYIDRVESHPFFELVASVVSKGVRRYTYERRAALLQTFFSPEPRPNNCVLINCQSSAENMYKLLMRSTPSFVEVTSCSKNCVSPRSTKLGIIHGEHSWLSGNAHFVEMIEGNVIVDIKKEKDGKKKKRTCDTDNCGGLLTTVIAETGRFIAISIDSRSTDRIKLNEIPRHVQLSFMIEEYFICGIVNFYEPKTTRRSLNDVGHYTAISLRKNGTWIEYDDKFEQGKSLRGNFLAHPSVIVYAKIP